MPSSHTLPDDPVYAFCPSYDLDNVPQQIRIVFDNDAGLRPHGAGGAQHSMMPCESAIA